MNVGKEVHSFCCEDQTLLFSKAVFKFLFFCPNPQNVHTYCCSVPSAVWNKKPHLNSSSCVRCRKFISQASGVFIATFGTVILGHFSQSGRVVGK